MIWIRSRLMLVVAILPAVIVSVLLAACGGSSSSANQATATPARRTAAGDVPDTAVYLRYHAKRFSIEYVEGWVLKPLTSGGVQINDKDSLENVALQAMPAGSLSAYVNATGRATAVKQFPQFTGASITSASIDARPSFRLSFRGRSAPDPVTGKSVSLIVDRYFVKGNTSLAVITLATPTGVDNIDAFKRMAHSFKWIHS